MIKDYLLLAMENLQVRPIRSWLTILGIVIGVFLIITLLSLTQGLKNVVLNELKMMGGDLIIIMPGELKTMMATFFGGLKLSKDDIEAVKRVEGVVVTIPLRWSAATVRHREKNETVLLMGSEWDTSLPVFYSDLGWSLKEGIWPQVGKREVVVGNLVPEDFFPDMHAGDEINIKGKEFVVAGILNSLGNRQDDSVIYLDMVDFERIAGHKQEAQMIMVKIDSRYSVTEVAEKIREALEETRKRKQEGGSASFSIITSEKASNIVSNIMAIIQVVVFIFASVAIVVGGIGITNTMYTAVYERTKEIGILKAIGAKNNAIVIIFLIESGILGFVGGIGGVILGMAFAKVVEVVAQHYKAYHLKASISLSLTLFGLIFSFLIGCLAGFFPAKKAAKLKPVDALRYE